VRQAPAADVDSTRRIFRRSAAGLAVALAFPAAALAEPDACTIQTATSVLCTGNQSGGIAPFATTIGLGLPLISPPFTTLNVNALTQGIAPAAGTAGILFRNDAGSALTVNVGIPTALPSIAATGNGAGGIVVNGFGTPTGTVNFFGMNLPSGGGGHGGNVNVTGFASITTDGNDAPGISARSRAGGYSDAVVATLQSFIGGGQAGTFSVTSVQGDTAKVNQQVTGTNGGTFTLLGSGLFFYNLTGIPVATLQPGQHVDTSVNYIVESNAGYAPSNATLTIRITRKDDGTLEVQPATFFSVYGAATASPKLPYTTTPQIGALLLQPDYDAWLHRLLSDSAVGGNGGNVVVTAHGSIETLRQASLGQGSYGIIAQSKGGTGRAGSSGAFDGDSGDPGGIGGVVQVFNHATIHTHGEGAHGIVATSSGGDGGRGGGASFAGNGGGGGPGSKGGKVDVYNYGAITTERDGAYGIFAQSIGGRGGAGGGGGAIGGGGGSGGGTSVNDKVYVDNSGTITTKGVDSYGVFAQNIGGFGGSGGGSSGIVALGSNGGNAGAGGEVQIANSGAITTTGMAGHALFAQSIGGGGGSAGSSSGLVAVGGDGNAGGHGGIVNVGNSAVIQALGFGARGIYAQSIGGGGGDGGNSGGLVGLGGDGATTSNGGVVTVTNTGAITSAGNAIFAESIGGGGGSGGSSGGWFAIGGSGGGGGAGEAVTVTNSGNLATSERNAAAIFAQSVGGGGGNGGNAVAVGAFVASAVGGEGGPGGNGAAVTVRSTAGTIETQGKESHGIFAQSVGGGGGNGGFAAAAAVGHKLTATVAVGRKGGGGGDGATVQVESGSGITTHGADAHGIFAQSVGGGGGNGGYSIAASAGDGIAISFSMGGQGGAGGSGSTVDVGKEAAVTGTIATHGDFSHGILAQSVGGGGGNGGMAIAGNINVGAQQSGGVSVALGGKGGSGGTGEAVKVTSGATITTAGEKAFGIKAQSIGGGGGDGGMAIAGSLGGPGAKQVNVALGGDGGAGSAAGTADVTTTAAASIETQGKESHGIFAQSVGGGGGTGGMAITAALGVGDKNINVGVAIGGSGGSGSIGERVTVTNGGAITTHGESAFGVFAQSIGGGGGQGGASFAGSATIIGPQADSTNANINVAIGGAGGSGNRGGDVNVINHGRLETFGTSAHGVFAESVGGGGGQGGSARTMSVVLGANPCSACSPNNVSLSLSMGGKGGSGGDGAIATVRNHDEIVTHGADSHGIYAQSVGGGGGTGGEGAHGFFGVPLIGIDKVPMYKSLSVSMGGNAGAAGDGKGVVVEQTGNITAYGEGSFGVLAQSVGGGGGTGGVGAIGFTGTVGVGGKGGAAGDGGDVQVTVNGNINTYGTAGYGVFAQSVGGGGGVAGNIDRGLPSILNVGIGVGVVLNSGNGGDGGLVTVTGSGDIHTRGSGAAGIFAQSVGGGGGVAGDLGIGIGYAGSAGGNGSGKKVEVDWTGRITTEGLNAHGIFAQSGGGTATNVVIYDDQGNPTTQTLTPRQNLGREVIVRTSGDITVNGAEANGIFAQSKGAEGNGNVSITVRSGTVQGGSGPLSAGIRIADGATNQITNFGTITTRDGVNGIAIAADAANEAVVNAGTITGSVLLGGGVNAITNATGATFNSGPSVVVGAGNVLVNNGTLAPGGAGIAATTALTGDFRQLGGTFAVDLDRGTGTADRVNASGTAQLGGRVVLTELNTGAATPGTRRYTIFQATGGAQNQGLTLVTTPSVVNTYQLSFPNATDTELTVVTDFAAPLAAAGASLNANQRAIGENVNAVQTAGGSPTFAPLGAALMGIPNATGLQAAYDALSPEPYANLLTATVNSNQRFSDAMLSCRVREGEYRFVDEGECYWFRGLGRWTRRDQTSANLGFSEDAGEAAGGLQKAINRNWFAGFAGSYEWSTLKTDDSAKSNGQRFQVGALVKAVYGGATFSLGVSAGNGTYDTRRTLNLPVAGTTVSGRQQIAFVSSHLRAGYAFVQKSWYVRPLVDLGATWTRLGDFQESGAGGAGLNVQSQNETYTSISPAIEAGGEIALANGVLVRPFATVGATHFFSGNTPQITAQFQGAPAGVAPFTVTGSMDRNYTDVGAGVDVLAKDGKVLRLSYVGQFGSDTRTNAVSLKLSIPF
jgi:uncharacterized protein YhjY with autotransporter beta-barrel domain